MKDSAGSSTGEVINKPTSSKPIKLSNKWLMIGVGVGALVLVSLIVATVLYMGRSKDIVEKEPLAQNNFQITSTQSPSPLNGNTADAAGLVNAKSLECVPRGHDNYRTNNTLAVDPNNANIVYVGVEYKGFFKSTNGGTTWTESDYGIRGYPKEQSATEKCIQEMGRTVIDSKDNTHLLLSRVESPGDLNTLFSENAGLWESKDSGATWTQLVKQGMNASGSKAIAFDPKDSKTIYMGVNNMLPSFTQPGSTQQYSYINKTGILYVTKNGGQTWNELPTGAEHGFRAINVAIDPSNSQTLWLFPFSEDPATGQTNDANQKGPMKSVDGGLTWTKYGTSFPTNYRALVDGVMNPKDSNNVFVPTQNTTGQQKSFVTTDDGNTWKQSNVYMYVASFDPNDSTGKRMLGYNPYENGGGIYESKDKGLTWAKYASIPAEVNNSDQLGVRIEGFAFSTSSKGTIYMSGSGANVWKSTDNGKAWTSVMNLNKIGGKNKNAQGSEKSRETDPGQK